MRLLSRVLGRTAWSMLFLCGLALVFSMFLGTADIVGTQFFGYPLPGALELTESTMVFIVFGALAYVQIRRGHIRVELLYSHMGPRVRAAMDAWTEVAALAYFGVIIWQGIGEASLSWHIKEASVGAIRFPLYPARWILVFGAGLLMVQLGIDLIHDVQRLVGSKAIDSPEKITTRRGESDTAGL